MAHILEVRHLTKTFNGLPVVDDFSMSIQRGRIIGLIGPNGAGKTTMFNIITGFLHSEQGKIAFKKKEITNWPPHKIAKTGIGRTFQDLRIIYELSTLENVLLSCPNQTGEALLPAILQLKKTRVEDKINKNKAVKILGHVGLLDERHHLAGDLSYGQQKLLAFACCLASEAQLLLLDEPVSGIYPDMIQKMLELMKGLINLGKTVLFIEHNIEAVKQISDDVIVMDHGQKIAEGAPSEVFGDSEMLEAYLE